MKKDYRLLQCLLALKTALIAGASGQVTYQHYRFEPVKLHAAGTVIQLSEFVFSHGGTRLNLVANNPELVPPLALGQNGTSENLVPVTVTGGSRPVTDVQGAPKIIDGTTGTKWLTGINDNSGEGRFLYFDFSSPVTVDSYSFATGGDTALYPNRNPEEWKIWGRNSTEDAWVLIDRVTGNRTEPRNEFYLQEFPLDGILPPVIQYFAPAFGSQAIVRNGEPVSLEWDTFDAESGRYPDLVTLTPAPGGGPIEGLETRSITPPPDADTVYTLTAANGSRTTSRPLTLRSVAGGSATHRFYRFSPVSTRPGANGHQLSEISFFHEGTELNLFATNASTPPSMGSTGTLDNLVNVTVTNPGGSQATNAALLADGLSSTKLFDARVRPVIFEFEQAVSIDAYRFTTANDFDARDPLRWTLEGSDDGISWTLVDNVTAFNYPTPTARFEQSQVFPLPGTSLDSNVVLPAPFTWTGSFNTNYDNAYNWEGGFAPGLIDEVSIATGNAVRGGNLERNGKTTVAAGGTLTVNGRLINRGDFQVTGGLVKQTGNYFIVGNTYQGTLRHSGGTVDSTLDRGFFLSDDGGAAGSKYYLSGTGQLVVRTTGNGNTSLGGNLLHNVHLGKGGTGDLLEISGGQAAFTAANNNFVYLSRTATLAGLRRQRELLRLLWLPCRLRRGRQQPPGYFRRLRCDQRLPAPHRGRIHRLGHSVRRRPDTRPGRQLGPELRQWHLHHDRRHTYRGKSHLDHPRHLHFHRRRNPAHRRSARGHCGDVVPRRARYLRQLRCHGEPNPHRHRGSKRLFQLDRHHGRPAGVAGRGGRCRWRRSVEPSRVRPGRPTR